MLFNNIFLCIWGDIFGLNNNGEILKIKYFQYFDRSKMRHDRAKIGLAGQYDRHHSKIILSPADMTLTWQKIRCMYQNNQYKATSYPS